jgi:proteasome alpha subunit
MVTPYDWQEGIGHRAQYVESRLAQGAPVLAVSLEAGVLLYTFRRQSRKIYEIYDQLVMAAIGQQSDVEALRVAAIDFAHQEGYNRSEQDVTIQRVVSALSGPVKKAFADFSSYPVVARALFVEVGPTAEEDSYYTLDYDGDYSETCRSCFLSGDADLGGIFKERLAAIEPSTSVEDALTALREAWRASLPGGEPDGNEDELTEEAVLVDRDPGRFNRFRVVA